MKSHRSIINHRLNPRGLCKGCECYRHAERECNDDVLCIGTCAVLTKIPSNVIVESGTDVTLECSSDTGGVSWLFDGQPITRNNPCESSDPRFVVSRATPGECHITALGRNAIHGPYVCTDGSNTAEALVIVIGNLILGL